MADTKILQAILDGQVQIREDLRKLEVKVDKVFEAVYKRFDKTDERINKLGMDLAELADDAPTREKFENLEQKDDKTQKQMLSL